MIVPTLLLACSTNSPKAPAPTPAPIEAPSPAPPSRSSTPWSFPSQEGWVAQEPSSGMRLAQFELPGADGAESASLVVYFFGEGGGGSVDANMTRWAGQFQVEGTDDPMTAATRETVEKPDRKLHQLALAGRYVAETAPGSGERVDHADWALRAVVLEAEGGPFFVKAVGPRATIEHWDASIVAMLEAAAPATEP